MIEIIAADGTAESPLADIPVLLATDDNYQRLSVPRCNTDRLPSSKAEQE